MKSSCTYCECLLLWACSALLRTLCQRPELIRRKYSRPVAEGGWQTAAGFPTCWETKLPQWGQNQIPSPAWNLG
eukprot:2753353-Pyramimonas_sp.AAC.1